MRTKICWLFLLGFGFTGKVAACCAVASHGVPVVNADQTVILLWDRERQTEHFIRKASFRSTGDSVGFLVPTPTRPQLEESGNEAFPYLVEITAPAESKSIAFPIGCASAPTYSTRGVRVIEEKTVAGYDVVVLAADSGKALTEWLREHDYAYTPEAASWAQPYLEKGWFMTAMKIAKSGTARAEAKLAASALRISFKTDRPLFPYREPDSRASASALHVSDRLLRIYFVAESRYDGRFSASHDWSGQTRWSGPLSDIQRRQLLRHLALPEPTGPARFWLTEFEDHWPYGKAPGDVYFTPSATQRQLASSSTTSGWMVDPTLAVMLGALFLFQRRTKA